MLPSRVDSGPQVDIDDDDTHRAEAWSQQKQEVALDCKQRGNAPNNVPQASWVCS
jgi:hypothetical protein